MQGKHILIGVSGSIASYKAATLIRHFIKAGASVKVIMTSEATHFISPLTLSTLSKNPTLVSFEASEGGLWNNHVELGLWADVFIVAPATASTLSRMAQGLSDNLLVATYLSARCPVFIVPAMDLDMWGHPSTNNNIQTLLAHGNFLIGPAKGDLASGLSGEGRMTEPEEIFHEIELFFTSKPPDKEGASDSIASKGEEGNPTFIGRKVLITAGATRENLDPVRYFSNHSTGKMGYALAEAFASLGAEVYLVSGPTSLVIQHPNIHVLSVTTAREMFNECVRYFSQCTIAVLAAAVADYRPSQEKPEKIKSSEDILRIELVKNPDIAKALGEKKQVGQILVGFALESENEVQNAIKKVKTKNLDFIVLNSLRDEGAGFGHDTNKITIIDKVGAASEFGLKSKREAADDIIQYLENLMYNEEL